MAAEDPSLGIQLRVRRSIDDLTALDLDRLRRAFAALMETSEDRDYRYWAGIHGLPLPIHVPMGKSEFLPWNRAYLLRFEHALQEFEPGVTLPWWDWTSAQSHQRGIPQPFAARTANGVSNPLYAVEIGAEVEDLREREVPSHTFREPGPPSRLPSESVVEELLQLDDFDTFASGLEALNGRIHVWVGGTNGIVSFTAYDPFFWAYQASIDRIWWLWQSRHPEVGAPESIADQPLAPLTVAVREIWSIVRLGYEYARPTPRSDGFRPGAACDLPNAADQLSFTDYAQAFAEIIASKDTAAPLTIGIYGSWGMGKSSLLKMIAKQFPKSAQRNRNGRNGAAEDDSAGEGVGSEIEGTERLDVYVVEFNAWKYSSSDKIWPALVRLIMERMEEESQWSYWARFANTLRLNLRRLWRGYRNHLVVALAVLPVVAFVVWQFHVSVAVIVTAALAIGVPGAFKLGEAIRNPVSRWVDALVEQDGYGEELPYMREIHNDLEFLTRQVQGSGGGAQGPGLAGGSKRGPRILVTIDDLDRCEPTKAVEVLRAINLLLDFPVFIVCLGIDARVITAAVEAYYGQLLGQVGASGYEYLDKIVQIPFRIPAASPLEVERFVEAQMPVRSVVDDAGDLQPKATGDAVDEDGLDYDADDLGDRSGAPPGEAPAIDLREFDRTEVEAFQALAPFIRRNPRHIKRLVNVYRLVRTLAVRRGVQEIVGNPDLTVAWIVICAQWPYTVGVMLRSFDAIVEGIGPDDDYPEFEPLPGLYRYVKPGLDPVHQRQIDDDIGDLEKLLNSTKMSWAELRTVQPYTLNFNPAIEAALHSRSPASANT